MLSEKRDGFEGRVEGLFTNRDLVSDQDDKESSVLGVDEVQPRVTC